MYLFTPFYLGSTTSKPYEGKDLVLLLAVPQCLEQKVSMLCGATQPPARLKLLPILLPAILFHIAG